MSRQYRPILPAPSSQDPTETGARSQDFTHTIGSSHKQFQKPPRAKCIYMTTRNSQCIDAAKEGSHWCSRHEKNSKGFEQADNGKDAENLKQKLGEKKWKELEDTYGPKRYYEQLTAQQAYGATALARQQELTNEWNAGGGKLYANHASDLTSAWDAEGTSSDANPPQQWDSNAQQSSYQAEPSDPQNPTS